jgi:hypothetical protein
MSFALLKDDIQFDGMDSSGKKTATRIMAFSCSANDGALDLAESPVMPSRGDVHPDYTLWTVDSIEPFEYSDVLSLGSYSGPGYMARVKYTYGGTDVGAGALSGKKPWELGATNFQTGTYEKEVPLKRIFQPKKIAVGKKEDGTIIYGTGKWVDYKNSAGFRKLGKDTVTVLRISFTLNYKHQKGVILPAPTDYSFNANAEKICNFVIPPYAGKLMPFSTQIHTVYDNSGKNVKYEYESANITLEIMQEATWIDEMLNTGTICLWEQTINGKKVMVPGAVYKYREISTYNANTFYDDILKAKPKFGSLEMMIAQRHKFVEAKGPTDKFPYEEFTEEVPQKTDGTLYEEALLDPNKDYLTKGGFTRAGVSWKKYNLPEKR